MLQAVSSEARLITSQNVLASATSAREAEHGPGGRRREHARDPDWVCAPRVYRVCAEARWARLVLPGGPRGFRPRVASNETNLVRILATIAAHRQTVAPAKFLAHGLFCSAPAIWRTPWVLVGGDYFGRSLRQWSCKCLFRTLFIGSCLFGALATNAGARFPAGRGRCPLYSGGLVTWYVQHTWFPASA